MSDGGRVGGQTGGPDGAGPGGGEPGGPMVGGTVSSVVGGTTGGGGGVIASCSSGAGTEGAGASAWTRRSGDWSGNGRCDSATTLTPTSAIKVIPPPKVSQARTGRRGTVFSSWSMTTKHRRRAISLAG